MPRMPHPRHTLGDAPIEDAYRQQMNAVAAALDEAFNGDARAPNKKVGFVLLAVFEYGSTDGRANFISNGAGSKGYRRPVQRDDRAV